MVDVGRSGPTVICAVPAANRLRISTARPTSYWPVMGLWHHVSRCFAYRWHLKRGELEVFAGCMDQATFDIATKSESSYALNRWSLGCTCSSFSPHNDRFCCSWMESLAELTEFFIVGSFRLFNCLCTKGGDSASVWFGKWLDTSFILTYVVLPFEN